MDTTKDILNTFIASEEKPTVQSIKNAIDACNDLQELNRYAKSKEPSVAEHARKRIKDAGPSLVASLPLERIFAILDMNLHDDPCIVVRPNLLARLDVICASMKEKELYALAGKIPKSASYWSICVSIITDNIARNIFDRVSALLSEKDLVDDVLLLVWNTWGNIHKFASGDGLKKLALAYEAIFPKADYEALAGWTNVIRNQSADLNAAHGLSGAFNTRLDFLIRESFSTESSIRKLNEYAWNATDAGLQDSIATRILSLVTPEIEAVTLDTATAMFTHGVVRECFFVQETVNALFREKIATLLREQFEKPMTFMEAYELIGKVAAVYSKESGIPNPVLGKCEELIPVEFKDVTDVVYAHEWLHKVPQSEALKKIVTDLLEKETDAKKIQRAWLTTVYDVASERLGTLVEQLDEPTDWFLQCITKQYFMDEKEVFLKKAQEFAKK
jgi:hypothetical protein